LQKKFVPIYTDVVDRTFKPHPVLHPTQLSEGEKQAAAWLQDEFYDLDKDEPTQESTLTESVTYQNIDEKGYEECNLADAIRFKMKRDKKRFWAGDNISDYLHEGDKEKLINEATEAFEKVLDTLLIDRETDPNSKGTAKRLAKMYFNEVMEGRYVPAPNATAFPNDSEGRYEGMLVVRSELRSMCSHHHQPVSGVAYIGIIAANKLIGLSKYTRIAQWCARRGTLQEELCNDIAREIMKATDSENVAVYIQATHGCCENRGIMAHSSLTQTTVLKGAFQTDSGTKKEFMDNIKLQQEFAPR
jgi:GTP cyclohydrolase I